MHVKVKDPKEGGINIRLPTRMFVNSLTASIAGSIVSKHSDVKLTVPQCIKFARAVNKAKVMLRRQGLPLVEVHSADGEDVLVSL